MLFRTLILMLHIAFIVVEFSARANQPGSIYQEVIGEQKKMIRGEKRASKDRKREHRYDLVCHTSFRSIFVVTQYSFPKNVESECLIKMPRINLR